MKTQLDEAMHLLQGINRMRAFLTETKTSLSLVISEDGAFTLMGPYFDDREKSVEEVFINHKVWLESKLQSARETVLECEALLRALEQ